MAYFLILDIAYMQGAEAASPYLEGHRRYLIYHYEGGRFLVSGRKDSGAGGIAIAVGTRDKVSEIVSEGPFVMDGVAEYAITEFVLAMAAPDPKNYREVLRAIK